MHALPGNLREPTGLDASALNAVLIASTPHLVLSGAAQGAFAGTPRNDGADWARVRAELVRLVNAVYAERTAKPE